MPPSAASRKPTARHPRGIQPWRAFRGSPESIPLLFRLPDVSSEHVGPDSNIGREADEANRVEVPLAGETVAYVHSHPAQVAPHQYAQAGHPSQPSAGGEQVASYPQPEPSASVPATASPQGGSNPTAAAGSASVAAPHFLDAEGQEDRRGVGPEVGSKAIPQPDAARGSWWDHWSSGVVIILLIIALVTLILLALSRNPQPKPSLLAEFGIDEKTAAQIELPAVEGIDLPDEPEALAQNRLAELSPDVTTDTPAGTASQAGSLAADPSGLAEAGSAATPAAPSQSPERGGLIIDPISRSADRTAGPTGAPPAATTTASLIPPLPSDSDSPASLTADEQWPGVNDKVGNTETGDQSLQTNSGLLVTGRTQESSGMELPEESLIPDSPSSLPRNAPTDGTAHSSDSSHRIATASTLVQSLEQSNLSTASRDAVKQSDDSNRLKVNPPRAASQSDTPLEITPPVASTHTQHKPASPPGMNGPNVPPIHTTATPEDDTDALLRAYQEYRKSQLRSMRVNRYQQYHAAPQ